MTMPVATIEGIKPYMRPPVDPIIDLRLDGNENTDGLMASLLPDELPTASLERYPDASDLEAAIARRVGVTSDRVVVTAGADEALDRVCRAWLDAERQAVLVTPPFEMTARYAALAGAEPVPIPWFEGDLPVDAIAAAAGPDAVVLLASPANPTGLTANTDDLVRLARACPSALVVIDLAYVEYADTDPTSSLLACANVVIVRSFSKAWGLAAARVGYAIAAAPAATALRAAGGPYSVAGPSLAVIKHCIEHRRCDELLERTRRATSRARAIVGTALRRGGAFAAPSQGNFVLARLPDASWFRASLRGLGIGVRTFDAPGLENAVRISCPSSSGDTDRLRDAIDTTLRPEAILLDMDGVIADVTDTYRATIIATAASFDVTATAAEVARRKRATGVNDDWELTRRLLEDNGVVIEYRTVRDRFQSLLDAVRDRERLIPRIDTIRALATRTRLAIVTGRPRVEALAFLERFRIPACFEAVVTREDGPAKPDPTPVRLALEGLGVRRAWMVGDTPDDVFAARGAGVVPLGVCAPSDSDAQRIPDRDALLRAGAARVISNLDDLLEMLP